MNRSIVSALAAHAALPLVAIASGDLITPKQSPFC